jgi:hypothetical protein
MRRHEQQLERQLRPFAAAIDRIVDQLRFRHPGRTVAEQMILGIRHQRLRRYLREYALRERALPSGLHRIPDYVDIGSSPFSFEFDFDAPQALIPSPGARAP